MNNQEYEQKKRECWEELWDEISGNIDFAPGVDDRMKEHIYDTFDRAYALGKQEKDAEKTQPPKFKRGDRVKTKYNDEYTVSAVEPITDKYMYSLVCDNKSWCGMHLESKLRKVENK